MIWNKVRECMSRDELAGLQGRQLVKLVEYMYQNAAYYRKKMQKLGLEPGDIRGIGDLGKLPFTTREDLAEAYPLGMFAVSGRKIVHYHVSDHKDGCYAGTETIAGYTQNDMDVWRECMARAISMAGMGEEDIIQIACDCGPGTDNHGAYCGAERIGAAVIPTPGSGPETLLALMRRLHVTGLVSTFSRLMRVSQLVEKRGLKNSLQLKAAICGGESWTEDIRTKLQDRLGIRIYDTFGLGELSGPGVACECECQNGMHVQEDFFLAEIVDQDTLHVLRDKARGELVFTTLQKEGFPLIRYRTGNITRIHYDKCECGRTMARIDRVCGRSDGMLLIRGKSVFVYQIEEALSGLRDIDAAYVVCVRTEHTRDVVDVCIEFDKVGRRLSTEDRNRVKHRVADAVYRIIKIMPAVQFRNSAADGLSVTKGKKVTIIDERRF